jgi:hypothetical protein
VDQDAIGWFYAAVFVFVVLPYLVMKIRALSGKLSEEAVPRRASKEPSRLRS